jgi:hypothetical protein
MKDDRRSPRSVRNTALLLAAVAVAVYLGFILLGVIRG